MVARPIILYGHQLVLFYGCNKHCFKFRIDAKVGSGNFGAVFKGAWLTKERVLEVAVKVLKTDSNIVERIKFLQEAAIMGQFHHPNITRLHGVVTMEEPVSPL